MLTSVIFSQPLFSNSVLTDIKKITKEAQTENRSLTVLLHKLNGDLTKILAPEFNSGYKIFNYIPKFNSKYSFFTRSNNVINTNISRNKNKSASDSLNIIISEIKNKIASLDEIMARV
jgi:hypothetical protein